MELVIKGFEFRTSGSAAPFSEFQRNYADIGALLGKEVILPVLASRVVLNDVQADAVELTLEAVGDARSIRLEIGKPQTLRFEQNIVGIEFTLALNE